jgi:predicted negative regulator of RcsB-dependent stress response
MPTTKECQHNAELCLRLASETKEIYAKLALLELAKKFRALAKHSKPARVANQNYVWRY